jgi:hypothetical protein
LTWHFRALHGKGGAAANPNEYTYSYFLKACNKLLPNEGEKKEPVDKAVGLACKHGLVPKT